MTPHEQTTASGPTDGAAVILDLLEAAQAAHLLDPVAHDEGRAGPA